jgi:hypothetical protein
MAHSKKGLRRRWSSLCAGLCAALLLSSASAQESGAPTPPEGLTPYDIEGARSLDVLTALAQQAEVTSDPRIKRELRFVHAAALADLWIIGQQTQQVSLLARVADSLGVPQVDVPARLESTLIDVQDEVVLDIVDDCILALRATTPQSQLRAEKLATAAGARASVVFVHAIARRVASEPELLAHLAAWGEDPCKDANACPAPYAPFDATGRRALSLLQRALSVAATLNASPGKDPFLAAIRPQLERDLATLRTAVLAPNGRLGRDLRTVQATAEGGTGPADVVLLVENGQARMGFVPRVRVDENGRLQLYAQGEPMLPATRSIELPASYPLYVKSVTQLVEALQPMSGSTGELRIAVGSAPDAPAHLWARSVLSAQRAGFKRIAMLAVDDQRTMRTVDVDVYGPLEAAEVGPRDLNVIVRLGGFTVKRQGPSVTIPRVQHETGFRFDYATLLQQAAPGSARSTKLSFMADVAADTLAETAFKVAPVTSALTVVLP